MKNTILFLAAGILTSQLSFAQDSQSIEQKLRSAGELEFLHCKPSDVKVTDTVVHYIIDGKSKDEIQLYVSPGLATANGKDLKNLTLIDSSLKHISTSNTEISFKSAINDLKFRLTIQDQDGLHLKGDIQQKRQTVPVVCKDVASE